MISKGINVVVLGVSCFDGMASSTRVRNLIEPLVEKNMITVSNLVYESDNRENIGKEGVLRQITYRVIGFKRNNPLTLVHFLSRGMGFLKKSRKAACSNIIYNYNYPDAKNIMFLLYGRLIGYRIVLDIVEDNRFESHVGWMNKVRVRTSVFLFSVSKYFTHCYVAISNHLFKRAEFIASGKLPVYLLPVTVDLRKFPSKPYSPDANNITLFYGGSFGQKDGLDYLVNAFEEVCKSHQNVRLVLSGFGNAKDTEKIKQRISSGTCSNRIDFKGYLDMKEYFTCLNSSDIFCMTRINSKFANAGFPFKLGEYLASGKGVIATNIGDVPNYLVNGVNALVISPDSASEIVKAIVTYLEDPRKICELGKEARKTAETYFDAEKVSMKLFSIFDSIHQAETRVAERA
jgi:glycosyltransferase involved in cell wall biosynthesis